MDRIPIRSGLKNKRLLFAFYSMLAALTVDAQSVNTIPAVLPPIPYTLDITLDNIHTTDNGISFGYTDPLLHELLGNIDLDAIWNYIIRNYECEGEAPGIVVYDNLTNRNIRFFLFGGLFKYSDVEQNEGKLKIEVLEAGEETNPIGVIVINTGSVVPLLRLDDRPRNIFYATVFSLLFHEMLHACQLTKEDMSNTALRQNSEQEAYSLTLAVDNLMRNISIVQDKSKSILRNSVYTKEVDNEKTNASQRYEYTKALKQLYAATRDYKIPIEYGFEITIPQLSRERYDTLREVLQQISHSLDEQ